MKALVSHISDGDIAVDVGANKGSYLYWLSRAARSGRVFAFEPQPDLAEYLRMVCTAVGLGNVTIVEAGVSDSSGSLTLHVPGESDSPGASFEEAVARRERCRVFEVPVITLDGYFAQRKQKISAIKIDVEGHELATLRGAEKILQEDSPFLVIESEGRHITNGTVGDVLDYLQSRGYSGSFVEAGRLVPISEFDPAVHQKSSGERFWDAKDYCNNFILERK